MWPPRESRAWSAILNHRTLIMVYFNFYFSLCTRFAFKCLHVICFILSQMDPIHPLEDPERAGIRKRDIQPPSLDDMHLVGRLRETVGLSRVGVVKLYAFLLHCFFLCHFLFAFLSCLQLYIYL